MYKLRENMQGVIKVLTEPEWNEFDRKIWGEFDRYIDDMHNFQGGGPNAHKFAIGRYKGSPAILSTVDEILGFEDRFRRTISVNTHVFCFENQEDEEFPIHTHVEWGEFFEGDGTFDIFSDKIPVSLMVNIELMFADFDEETAEYVMGEVESCDKINDERVRSYIEKQIAELGSSD